MNVVLPIQVFVQWLDASNLILNLLPFQKHLLLLPFHFEVHLLKSSLLHLKVLVLSSHDLFVLIQEVSHFIQFFVSQNLELFKVGCDFIGRWDRCHLGNACLQQLVLGLHNAFIVPEQLLHLDDRGHAFVLIQHWVRGDVLVKYL